MERFKSLIASTLIAAPMVALLYYILLPPQCPGDYTQAQIDASRCVVGANIGGWPVFILATVLVVIGSFKLAQWLTSPTTERPQPSKDGKQDPAS